MMSQTPLQTYVENMAAVIQGTTLGVVVSCALCPVTVALVTGCVMFFVSNFIFFTLYLHQESKQ